MFSLIRRISHSVIPRPDRPWEDDPTSNAPNTKRKRRLSSTERLEHADDDQTKKKKLRGESTEVDLGSEDSPTPAEGSGQEDGVTVHREGSLEVKSVTKGVKEVDLEDKDNDVGTDADADAPHMADDKRLVEADVAEHEAAANPASIPLPEEEAGELDDLRSSSPPQVQPQSQPDPPEVTSTEDPTSSRPVGRPTSTVVDDQAEPDSNPSVSSDTHTRASPRKTRASPKKVIKTQA